MYILCIKKQSIFPSFYTTAEKMNRIWPLVSIKYLRHELARVVVPKLWVIIRFLMSDGKVK